MTPEEAIEFLKGMQNKKIDYAEMVCAPAFAYGYEYVYPEPEDYAIEEAVKALKEVQQYRKIKKQLESVYGKCDGLLETVVDHLVKHENLEIDEPVFKTILLTDDDVDRWKAYKEIGTVEELREAMEKQNPKKPIPINYGEYVDKIVNAEFLEDTYFCPNCKTVLRSGSCCNRCGQKLDWSKKYD